MDKEAMLIGLTGQTGAGKTTVSTYLRKLGHRVIDADLASREAVRPGSECLARLVFAFGEEILRPDGSLDRKMLGRLAFSDIEKKQLLESIIFPYIFEIIGVMQQKALEEGAHTVFLDAPTLFESGGNSRCRYVISVIAPEAVRLLRIMARDGISREDAVLRMRAQQDDEFYTLRSDFVLCNDGDRDDLYKQVDAALSRMALEVTP